MEGRIIRGGAEALIGRWEEFNYSAQETGVMECLSNLERLCVKFYFS